jgi:hypothetical protein
MNELDCVHRVSGSLLLARRRTSRSRDYAKEIPPLAAENTAIRNDARFTNRKVQVSRDRLLDLVPSGHI